MNETKEYPYVFNMVAFNQITMEWMVVSRVRITREDHNAYALGLRKTFEKCKRDHQEFELGKSLLGIVIDWSDAKVTRCCWDRNGKSSSEGMSSALEPFLAAG